MVLADNNRVYTELCEECTKFGDCRRVNKKFYCFDCYESLAGVIAKREEEYKKAKNKAVAASKPRKKKLTPIVLHSLPRKKKPHEILREQLREVFENDRSYSVRQLAELFPEIREERIRNHIRDLRKEKFIKCRRITDRVRGQTILIYAKCDRLLQSNEDAGTLSKIVQLLQKNVITSKDLASKLSCTRENLSRLARKYGDEKGIRIYRFPKSNLHYYLLEGNEHQLCDIKPHCEPIKVH